MWKPIPGFAGYEVSDEGQVWSRRWVVGRMRSGLADGRVEGYWMLTPYTRPKGYLSVTMRRKGKTYSRLVHQLVLEAFVGPCPPGHECRHLNGDPADNQLKNLAWGTAKANGCDQIAHGRTTRGERHRNHKLTETEARKVKASNEGTCSLARRYGVSPATICDLRHGRTWAWL